VDKMHIIYFKNKKILLFIVSILILLLFFLFSFNNRPVISNIYDMKFIAVIDPGHGGIDTGTHYNQIMEKNINLNIAKLLKKEYESVNIIPILSRSNDSLYKNSRNKDIFYRPKISKKYNTDIYISIHVNSFPSAQASGSQIFYKSGSVYSKLLAEMVDLELKKIMSGNREIKKGNFIVLNMADCPAILIETGFITNPLDRKKITDPNYQKQIARAIKNGSINYFNKILGD